MISHYKLEMSQGVWSLLICDRNEVPGNYEEGRRNLASDTWDARAVWWLGQMRMCNQLGNCYVSSIYFPNMIEDTLLWNLHISGLIKLPILQKFNNIICNAIIWVILRSALGPGWWYNEPSCISAGPVLEDRRGSHCYRKQLLIFLKGPRNTHNIPETVSIVKWTTSRVGWDFCWGFWGHSFQFPNRICMMSKSLLEIILRSSRVFANLPIQHSFGVFGDVWAN